jgi:beta-amylase
MFGGVFTFFFKFSGIVETSPRQYNWKPYLQLAQMCKDFGIKMQVVLSFHQCGGNTGDTCSIPIPQFVRDSGNDGFYKDRNGFVNKEYISLGADDEPIFAGRTAIQMYNEFMISFRSAFQSFLGSTIPSIEVGLGPAGELRYPSYPEALGRWRFPGIGEFQCYDKYMLKSLKDAAVRAGKRLIFIFNKISGMGEWWTFQCWILQ